MKSVAPLLLGLADSRPVTRTVSVTYGSGRCALCGHWMCRGESVRFSLGPECRRILAGGRQRFLLFMFPDCEVRGDQETKAN